MKETRKVRNTLIIICILVVLLFVWIYFEIFCRGYSMPADGPKDYGPAKWVSESPDIWFEVKGDEGVWNGKMVIEGIEYPCKVMAERRRIYFFKEEEIEWQKNLLFRGDFDFRPKKSIPVEFVSGAPRKMKVYVIASDSDIVSKGECVEFTRYAYKDGEYVLETEFGASAKAGSYAAVSQ